MGKDNLVARRRRNFMLSTDIRIRNARCAFTPETFRIPLKLSSGPISECYYAQVEIEAENREGGRAAGIGGIYLSDLWAFPGPGASGEQKTKAMMTIVELLTERLAGMDGFRDAMQWGRLLAGELEDAMKEAERRMGLAVSIPRLAGLVASSPLDAALHDAWGKAAGRNSYVMYGAAYLNDDLSVVFGAGWEGKYPGDALLPSVRSGLTVQHVVGTDDPLTEMDVKGTDRPADDLPYTLEEWIAREKVHALKIKSKGIDAKEIAERIRDVHRAAALAAERFGVAHPIRLSLDPNEAFPHPDPLVELLHRLREKHPETFRALEYIEQPTPRDLSRYDFTLHEASALKPIIIDESLDRIDRLPLVKEQGWSGVALKACKGQTHTLEAYSWAREHGLFVAVQDLTNAGFALVQSANLFARLAVSADVFEYNSRQYTPFARPETQEQYPALFRVANGQISTADIRGIGLY